MSDPNDFTRPLADLIASLEGRVRLGVEQPGAVVAIFKHAVPSIELPPDTIGVARVAGLRGQRYTVFAEGTDYTVSGGRLLWTGAPADEGARLDIETVWREPPSGLTDFNPGSVAGTLLRAVARELALMYAQMDQAYRRAFIDDATGVALDNVVALLGVGRIAAQAARGQATFLRKKPAAQAVTVAAGTRVADKAGRVFATLGEVTIRASAEEVRSPAGGVLTTTDKIGALLGVWPVAADPQATLPLAVATGFGDDERQITLAAAPPAGDLRIRYQPRSATADIVALQPGPDGNVNAGSLTLMPTPPRNIDAVTNETPTRGGQDAEADDRLRERAKHALEEAGNATLNAIRFAVLKVEGVQGVEVLDHQRDDTIPLGEVRVRYAGADSATLRNAVIAAVEATRAAGVMARVEQITQVTLTGRLLLVPATAADATGPAAANASAAFVAAAVGLVNALQIGQALSLRKLQALAYAVPGLADMAEAQLLAHQPLPSSPGVPVLSDPLFAAGTELLRTSAAALQPVLLAGLKVVANRSLGGGAYQVDLQLVDAAGAAPVCHALALDLFVAVRAHLQTNVTEAPLRVGSFTRAVHFADSATATLDFAVAADVPGFDPGVHVHTVQLLVNAAAYAGLQATSLDLDITA
jgi:uncharacterized phage protein gp47/JayE